jgi:hypothetical protein
MHMSSKPEPPGSAARLTPPRPENMIASLQMLRENYGSVEDYVTKHCGLSPQDVEQIRRNMTVDSASFTDTKTAP